MGEVKKMISRDKAYKRTSKVINSRPHKELKSLQATILYSIAKGHFSLTRSNISEITIDAIKEKGYDVTERYDAFGETYYEISWGPKEEE